MPVTWNSEANARLFLGVLTQLKNQSIKLDYTALANSVGQGCTVRAVQQQMDKLRKQVSDGSSNPATPVGTPRRQAATAANSGPSSQALLSAKRKAARIAKPKTPTKKSRSVSKVVDKEESSEEDSEENTKSIVKGEDSEEDAETIIKGEQSDASDKTYA
ncbi:hypothetical protein BO86DRAFT_403955 [Aspergillus japonicus CBS 114.51]|uniref:Uncharacterized protein n=1 Tax=Aspergillus japonicus CBS 114.51 TaxID=1448312 RepID=A0A8T8WN12_ASPJA|nr:hypothetical protein BO86DRAFT_403955 [Aspergillus japonicus CBS 114.51]RAH77245.1 hypothetical protein BO86DRAFT_403955 [Aspergillus japonicus CBS 114.51]